jgi:hypothetical protein
MRVGATVAFDGVDCAPAAPAQATHKNAQIAATYLMA